MRGERCAGNGQRVRPGGPDQQLGRGGAASGGHENSEGLVKASQRSGWGLEPSRFDQYQGEVGPGCHQDLEEGLATAEVARLARTELDHPGNSVLDDLPLLAVVVKIGTSLPLFGGLNHRLLRVQIDRPSPPRGFVAVGAQL